MFLPTTRAAGKQLTFAPTGQRQKETTLDLNLQQPTQAAARCFLLVGWRGGPKKGVAQGSVWLHGTVRAVPVFGSDGSCLERGFQKGTVPVPVSLSVSAKRFRRFCFPVLVPGPSSKRQSPV